MRRLLPLACLAACAPAADSASVAAHVQPNILVVIADDLGLDAASFDRGDPCYAVGDVDNDGPMPHVAKLCREGVVFDRAWAFPHCSPTRASMLTGRLPSRHGVGDAVAIADGDGIRDDEVTLPRALDALGAGYDLANIGKWHVSSDPGDPNRFGWHHYAGPYGGAMEDYWRWYRVDDGVESMESGYATHVNVRDATAWLEARGDAPWFLWLAFSAPHDPFHLPPADLHDTDLPDDVDLDDPRPWYAAMETSLDTALGQVLDAVDARGELDHTVIVFLGDNGSDPLILEPPYPEGHGKGTLYQGGIAVPLIVAGPGVAGGRRTDALVSVVDLYATLLDLAGVSAADLPDDHVRDSVSFAPLLRDPLAGGPRRTVVSQSFQTGAPPDEMAHAIRNDRYKLLCTGRTTRLYDLDADPYELRDLLHGAEAPQAEHVAAVAALRDELEAITGDASLCPR